MKAMSGLAPPSGFSGFARPKYSSLVSRSSWTFSPSSTFRLKAGSTPSAGQSASARLWPWRRPISR